MSLAQIGEFSFIIAGARAVAGGDRRLPLSGRGRGLGDHHADDAVADPRFGPGGLARRPQAAAPAADLRRALRQLAGAAARDARAAAPPGRGIRRLGGCCWSTRRVLAVLVIAASRVTRPASRWVARHVRPRAAAHAGARSSPRRWRLLSPVPVRHRAGRARASALALADRGAPARSAKGSSIWRRRRGARCW